MELDLTFKLLPPGEAHACFVGSGECFTPAAYKTDDGEGNTVYVCAAHAREIHAMTIFLKANPHIEEQLEAAIEEVERKSKK